MITDSMFTVLGIVLLFSSALLVLFVVFRPSRRTVSMERRRPTGSPAPSLLTKISTATTALVVRLIPRGRTLAARRFTLEQAGISMAAADLVILVGAATLAAGVLGLVFRGLLFGFLFAVLVPAVALCYLSFCQRRRTARFESQLGETITMISSSLRAGHSVMRAIDVVAQEAPEPTATEFAGVVNENALGRDLQDSLSTVSLRMKSEDFEWMAQAIEINREVGGDLAEVFDQVGATIRERSQIRGQIKALSAEGKLSAIILMALPVMLFVMIGLANPDYAGKLTSTPIGWGMLTAALLMMVIGGLWIRKISDLKF